jgi:hypothetical protein
VAFVGALCFDAVATAKKRLRKIDVRLQQVVANFDKVPHFVGHYRQQIVRSVGC